MSSITSKEKSQGLWSKFAPCVIPSLSASVAIVFVFGDLIAKSTRQKGQPLLPITPLEGLKQGCKAAPTVGLIVGVQMAIQDTLEKIFTGGSNQVTLTSMLISSGIVGTLSAPVLAVFNGQTITGQSITMSLKRLSPKQAVAITLQETAFVAGLSAADRLVVPMKQKFGDNRVVEYVAAFIAGSVGSLVGHPANTALTRWQSGLSIDTPDQLMRGALLRARAIGLFAVIYAIVKEQLNSTVVREDK